VGSASRRTNKLRWGKAFPFDFDVKRVDALGTRGFSDAEDIVSRKNVLIPCNPDRDLHLNCTMPLVYFHLNCLSHEKHWVRPYRLTRRTFDYYASFQVEARAVGATGHD